MPTPIRQRFSVTTLVRDQVAGLQSLSESVLITTNDIFSGDRYRQVTLESYADDMDSGTYPVEAAWLQAHFGQALKPESAGILYWDKAGLEDVEDAIDALYSLGAEAYVFHYIGVTASDVADQLDIAKHVEALSERAQFICMTQDANAINAVDTTDIGYQARALTLNRTTCIYHPASVSVVQNGVVSTIDTSAERPDAAVWGRMGTTDEGAEQFDYKGLSLVQDSNLGGAVHNILRDKGYNWIERIKRSTVNYIYPGRTCTDREIRIQWGADWFDINVQTSLANFALRTDLMAFDQDTFVAVEGI
ncbi:MAG: DUF3383 family protein, partial [Reinekea sp.]|nr:DUF3383 family protein [Reinekea sp.]